MLFIATRISLVILAGVYAMRSSNVLFHPESFQPLTGVAIFAFVMTLVYFNNPPTTPGWWLYTSIVLCLVGVVANTMLFVAPDASHGTPTNLAFSAVSIVGWTIVAIGFAAKAFQKA